MLCHVCQQLITGVVIQEHFQSLSRTSNIYLYYATVPFTEMKPKKQSTISRFFTSAKCSFADDGNNSATNGKVSHACSVSQRNAVIMTITYLSFAHIISFNLVL